MKKTIISILTIIGGFSVVFGILWLITLTPIWPFPLFEWEYEEFPRVESPNGQFEIVPFRGNAGAVSGFTYELFVVTQGKNVDRETDSMFCVFVAYEDTKLDNYRWQNETVEIEIEDGSIGYYKTFYGNLENYHIKKVGDVTLNIKKTAVLPTAETNTGSSS